jgi:hypothetical protein
LREYILSGVSFAVGFEGFVFACPHADRVSFDENNNLHNEKGAAISWKGFSLNYLHGVFFKKNDFARLVKRRPNGRAIMAVENAEQKAALIQLWGYERILKSCKSEILDTKKVKSKVDGKTCTYQVLEIKLTERLTHRIVAVECHSTHKKTFLGVRRTEETKTCAGAIASTFPGTNYKPEAEA